MRIAIAGGTGTIGRLVVAELRERGHEVRALSRSAPDHPVDLTTGEGLDAALEGCKVVVDASNQPPNAKGAKLLPETARRLLEAEARAGVGHHVCISIVGCDRVPMAYYRGKAAQERAVEDGPVAFTIVRATQFHELVDGAFAALGRARVLPVPRGRLQTVAAAEAAHAVADAAEDEPLRGRIDVAGPETLDARAMARAWREARGRRAAIVPLPLPGRLGRALRDGVLTAEDPDVRATTTFATWLQTTS